MVQTIAVFDFLRNYNDVENIYLLRNELGTSKFIVAAVLFSFVFILGVVGNLMMIIISNKMANKRKTIPNKLIWLLSIVDLWTIFTVYLPTLLAFIFGRYVGGTVLCNLQASFILFFHSFSILIGLAIIYDRYLAVAEPYYYHDKMKYSNTKGGVLIFVSVIISALISIPPLIGLGSNLLIYPGSFCSFTMESSTKLEKWSLIFYISVIGIYTSLVVVGCIGAILNVNKMLDFRAGLPGNQSINNREELMFIRLSTVSMAIFLFIWTPVTVLMVLSLTPLKIPTWYTMIAYNIAALHAIVNPWLYPILRNKFRKAFKSVFATGLHCTTCGLVETSSSTLDQIINDSGTSQQQRNCNIELNERKNKVKDYVDGTERRKDGREAAADQFEILSTTEYKPVALNIPTTEATESTEQKESANPRNNDENKYDIKMEVIEKNAVKD